MTHASTRARTLIASIFAALLAALACAHAEPLFSFDATPGKLPKSAVPTHYAIDLRLEVALDPGQIVLGTRVEQMTDDELAELADRRM
jgi:hypothetical protein